MAQLKSELIEELSLHILPFWQERMQDHTYGGYLGQLDFYGNPVEKANKGCILNARILWTFSAAYRQLPREEYIHMAHRSFYYIMDRFLDPVHGGTFWSLDHTGEPVSDKKQIYALAFTIYGLTAYHLVTGNDLALQTAKGLFQDIELHAFDEKRNGYFEALKRDWKPLEDLRLSEKDPNECKTMNTHLHILEAYTALYQVWPDDLLGQQLQNLVVLFIERFINEKGQLNLFFDDDWNLRSDKVSFGHNIECAWLLQEAAEVVGEPGLTDLTKQNAIQMAEAALHAVDQDGGLFYEYFPGENRWDQDKHWWPQAEAIVGFINAWQLTGDIRFSNAAVNSWRFIKDYLVDRENGEWHWSVDRDGIPQTSEEKAGFWKCPYHNSRACLELMKRI